MSTSPAKNYSRLSELDALRGFAALLVVAFHLTMFCDIREVTKTFKYGMTGVQLFFMLSGFVIFMSLNNIKTGKEFIIHRFARLYPIYWVCVALTFLLRIGDSLQSHEAITMQHVYNFLTNLTMIQYYFKVPDMDAPYWSLIIELLFYVLIFSIYKLKLLRYTEYILCALVVVELVLLILQLYLPGNAVMANIIAGEKYFPLIHHLPLFLTGIVFYRIFIDGGNMVRYCIILICFFTQVFEYPHLILNLFNITQEQFVYVLVVYFTLFILFTFGYLRFIAGRFTIFLGRISYALYLFHQFIATHFVIPLLTYKWHIPYMVSALITLVLVITIAAINTLYIDEPLRFRIRKSFTSHKFLPEK